MSFQVWLSFVLSAVAAGPDFDCPVGVDGEIPFGVANDDGTLWGTYDAADVIVMRPLGTRLSEGFTFGAMQGAVVEALRDRQTTYDFAVVVNNAHSVYKRLNDAFSSVDCGGI